MASATKKDVVLGTRLRQIFTQGPGETYSLLAQQLMLDVVLEADTDIQLDIELLKRQAPRLADLIKSDADYEVSKTQLTEQVLHKKETVQ